MSDIQNLFIVLQVENDKGDVEKEYLVNYTLPEIKSWIVRTTVWAVTNARTIVISAASQEDLLKLRIFTPKLEAVA